MQKEQIIKKIKQKKELSGIDGSIVLEVLIDYLKRKKISLKNLKESGEKIIIKDIRSKLREYAGRFQIGKKDRHKLMEKGELEKILKTHSSTKERFFFYPELKKIIKNLNVHSILDLGCGLNPIALATSDMEYYASDINWEELKLIERFFAIQGIKGETFFCNLKEIEKCQIPKTDICLIFKVFDILGENDYKIAENIIGQIKSRYILSSFSTRTLSGRPMNKPRRIWFEKLLEKLKFSFKIIKSQNEIFYLSEKI